MGWLTTEELWWDDKGQLRTHAPSTYKIPLASDRPQIFNVKLADWSRTASRPSGAPRLWASRPSCSPIRCSRRCHGCGLGADYRGARALTRPYA
jgi:hypothetical protein